MRGDWSPERRHLRQQVAAGVVCCWAAAVFAAAEPTYVTLGEGTVVIKADQAPLGKILGELNDKVEFQLIEYVDTSEFAVSIDSGALPWEETFAKLLGGFSYTLEMHSGTGLPKRLIVLARPETNQADLVPTAPEWEEWAAEAATDDEADQSEVDISEVDIEVQIRQEAERLFAPRDYAGEAIAAVIAARDAMDVLQTRDSEVEDYALDHPVAEAREDYVNALQNLADFDDPRAVEALLPALDSDQSDAQIASLQSMRWVGHTSTNQIAVNKALSMVESADPQVQRAALEVVVRYGDQANVLPALEKLALVEGPNQDLAVREWLRIREEQRGLQQLQALADREGVTLDELRRSNLRKLLEGRGVDTSKGRSEQ